MKKLIKNLLVYVVVLCSLVSVTGCFSRDNETITINKDQTQLYICNFNAGFGADWLTTVGAKFEKEYADYEFEAGKKGVQIIPDNTDSIPSATTVKNSRDSVYFVENVDYYDFIAQGVAKDITDLVAKPVADNETSISAKMESYGTSNTGYYKTSDNKYYGVPFHEGLTCMIYDADLFYSKSLYLSKAYDSGARDKTAWTDDVSQNGSRGPDGKYGTFDDGLPATYDDFYFLLDRMKEKGVTPMTWAGKYPAYTSKALLHFWATNVGAEQMTLNFTFNGNAEKLANVKENGNVELFSESVDETDAWKLQQQYGKYQALEFAGRIAKDSTNYHYLASSGSETQMMAQSTFLYSEMKNEPIAILFDGTWWQREATPVFSNMEAINKKYSKQNRNFGILPIPHASSDDVGKEQVYLGGLNSFIFINSAIKDSAHLAAAEEFLKFIHREENLKIFTEETGATRPYAYDFTEKELKQLPYFTQSSWNIHKNATIINPRSNVPLMTNNYSEFNLDEVGFRSSVNRVNYDHPFVALKSMSVNDYFTGMSDYKRSAWSKLIK